MIKVGILGGSGIYDIEGIQNIHSIQCHTPFGDPSDELICGNIGYVEVVFLARHGRGHRILPSEINHRANIFALKSVGVNVIISLSAVGSLKETLKPGDIVLVDQFVDRTRRPGLDHTFFGDGIVAHISFAHPTCQQLREILFTTITSILEKENPHRVTCHQRGTYLNMEGPAFSTLAESKLYQSWGMDVIGMTNLAEARLAREAEICYQTLAMVTDYDCWHQEYAPVDVQQILTTLHQNSTLAKKIIREVVPILGEQFHCSECPHALQGAIITHPDWISTEIRRRLAPIIGKYFPLT